MATLHLIVKKIFFDQIQAGEKTEEYRAATAYWKKRIEGRKYDKIRFVNGYGRARPALITAYHGYLLRDDFYILSIGPILESS